MRVSFRLKIIACCIAALGLICSPGAPVLPDMTIPWQEADSGLLVAEFDYVFKNDPYAITLIKIDPKQYSFKLLCAAQSGKQSYTTKEWAEKHQMLATVNAGMFQQNGLTSVGFMKNFDHVNNPKLSSANTVLAFNPVDESIPEVQIIDRECQNFSELRNKYQSFLQSIRMISCNGQNVWNKLDSKWSVLALGMDTQGNILFLFSRKSNSVHDFIEILMTLPLSLKSAMYLEGGPQASLYLSTPKMTLQREGALGSLEENSLPFPLPVPNVIGIFKKPQAKT
jgi:uncharacterized protein YigE (DUF2233 family)